MWLLLWSSICTSTQWTRTTSYMWKMGAGSILPEILGLLRVSTGIGHSFQKTLRYESLTLTGVVLYCVCMCVCMFGHSRVESLILSKVGLWTKETGQYSLQLRMPWKLQNRFGLFIFSVHMLTTVLTYDPKMARGVRLSEVQEPSPNATVSHFIVPLCMLLQLCIHCGGEDECDEPFHILYTFVYILRQQNNYWNVRTNDTVVTNTDGSIQLNREGFAHTRPNKDLLLLLLFVVWFVSASSSTQAFVV